MGAAPEASTGGMMMKKILLGLVLASVVCGTVQAGSVMFTGIGTNYSGIGSWAVYTDGTNTTLYVDKIVAKQSYTNTIAKGALTTTGGFINIHSTPRSNFRSSSASASYFSR